MLASIPGGVGERALAALGVDADALARAVDEARGSGRRSSLLLAPEPLEEEFVAQLRARLGLDAA